MAYINMKDVSFAYPGGFLAVDNINLQIERGEAVAIIGQNGAGKTTTVKMLNGLERPTKGEVLVGEMNTKDYTTAQVSRVVGYVFQNPDDQIFHSTVRSEVEFGPRMMKLPREQVEAQVNFALEITGLEAHRETNPYDLPLSIRKFVTIASVIAMDTEVYVFDEPTAGQDLRGNRYLAEILRVLKEKGKTIITISHDMEFVASNFERVVIMANKKIVTSGTPREIFWNFEALEQARLKQPYVSRLARAMGLEGQIINMQEAVAEIRRKCLEN